MAKAKHGIDLNDPRLYAGRADPETGAFPVVHEGRTWMEDGTFDDLEEVEGETDHQRRIRERRPETGLVQVAVCLCGEEIRGRNGRQILAKFAEHEAGA